MARELIAKNPTMDHLSFLVYQRVLPLQTPSPTSPSSSSQDSVFDVNRYTENPVPERSGSTSEELLGDPLHESKGKKVPNWECLFVTVPPETHSDLIHRAQKIEFESCKCCRESSRKPQHSKWNGVGTNRPRHIHMNTPKIRILPKKFPRRQNSNSNLLINSKKPRNLSNRFRAEW